MHKEILTKEQIELFPFLKKIRKDFGLVGGTAIALHIGHRRSIDFDLFSYKVFKNSSLKNKIESIAEIDEIIVDKKGELTLFAHQVKITFFHYPFEIPYKDTVDNFLKMPDLLTLAAMKAYALGRRAKWKDYVNLYFILKSFYSIDSFNTHLNSHFLPLTLIIFNIVKIIGLIYII